MSIDYTHGVVGRDPIGKTMVASFLAEYLGETDEQIWARMDRAWRSLSPDTDMPITADEIGHWRAQIGADG